MNERKVRILEAIIQDYIQTGSPVGSRTLSKKYDLKLSSATIRNEMSDLEELGLITQPHASSGRIPSDKGYRLYVDNLMSKEDLGPELNNVIGKMLHDKMNNIDSLIEETAKLVALTTNYATIASTFPINKPIVKRVQIMPVESRHIVCVVVTDANLVRHQSINTDIEVSELLAMQLTTILNDSIMGMTALDLRQCNIDMIEQPYKLLVIKIINTIIQILSEKNYSHVFARGTTNILDFQEFNDMHKARELLELLNKKPYLNSLLAKSSTNSVSIKIGEENNNESMKECSVITTTYKVGECTLGSIGIIGPKRMNYSHVVSLLEQISAQLTQMFGADFI